jgi:hypothetical protein
MYRTFIAILLVGTLSSCARFSQNQSATVESAIGLQSEVLIVSDFWEILANLENQGAIKWDAPLIPAAESESLAFPNRTAWLIAKFKAEGPFQRSQIKPWRKWNPFSSTTASTAAGTPRTRLNLWRLDRTSISIANTLFHERVHGFGQVHAHGQTKNGNQCDAAYVVGDLAEYLLVERGQIAGSEGKVTACAALCSELTVRFDNDRCVAMREDG